MSSDETVLKHSIKGAFLVVRLELRLAFWACGFNVARVNFKSLYGDSVTIRSAQLATTVVLVG
jgi:hypothetical protein